MSVHLRIFFAPADATAEQLKCSSARGPGALLFSQAGSAPQHNVDGRSVDCEGGAPSRHDRHQVRLHGMNKVLLWSMISRSLRFFLLERIKYYVKEHIFVSRIECGNCIHSVVVKCKSPCDINDVCGRCTVLRIQR